MGTFGIELDKDQGWGQISGECCFYKSSKTIELSALNPFYDTESSQKGNVYV